MSRENLRDIFCARFCAFKEPDKWEGVIGFEPVFLSFVLFLFLGVLCRGIWRRRFVCFCAEIFFCASRVRLFWRHARSAAFNPMGSLEKYVTKGG